MATGLLERSREVVEEILLDVRRLVEVESPSRDPAATDACGEVLAELVEDRLGGGPERHHVDGRTHWSFTWGRPRVLLLGHLDTVWPAGTLQRWPMRVDDGVASGPGIFDMKAGLACALHGLRLAGVTDGVRLLVTCDEEVGSPTSRGLVEELARDSDAVLVLEPGLGGALKTERKGVSAYRVEVVGRAAHAGLDPERGVNALAELASQVLRVIDLAAPEFGTTVTPTVAEAGSTINVVPARAEFQVDVRARTVAELERVDRAIHALVPVADDAGLLVHGGINRPPLEGAMSAALFSRARRVASSLGLPDLREASVGGGSDGNFTAAVGTPTLDGLGPAGDGAHAEGEHVLVAGLPAAAALVGGLVADLLDVA